MTTERHHVEHDTWITDRYSVDSFGGNGPAGMFDTYEEARTAAIAHISAKGTSSVSFTIRKFTRLATKEEVEQAQRTVDAITPTSAPEPGLLLEQVRDCYWCETHKALVISPETHRAGRQDTCVIRTMYVGQEVND